MPRFPAAVLPTSKYLASNYSDIFSYNALNTVATLIKYLLL